MKQYQTIIGLGIVSISILAAALILQYQDASSSVSNGALCELSDGEKSKVETSAVFKSFLVNRVTQYKASPKEKSELYKDRREEDSLTLNIYNGNTNIYVKSIDLKIAMYPSSKAKRNHGPSLSNPKLYRVVVDCPPLSCKTTYVKCMHVPDPLMHENYKVSVVSMKGKITSTAKE